MPNVDLSDIKGYVICEAGFSRYQDFITKGVDGRNRVVYWIGGTVPTYEPSQYEQDFYVLQENKVSITPLKINFNQYEKIETMSRWIKGIDAL